MEDEAYYNIIVYRIDSSENKTIPIPVKNKELLIAKYNKANRELKFQSENQYKSELETMDLNQSINIEPLYYDVPLEIDDKITKSNETVKEKINNNSLSIVGRHFIPV